MQHSVFKSAVPRGHVGTPAPVSSPIQLIKTDSKPVGVGRFAMACRRHSSRARVWFFRKVVCISDLPSVTCPTASVFCFFWPPRRVWGLALGSFLSFEYFVLCLLRVVSPPHGLLLLSDCASEGSPLMRLARLEMVRLTCVAHNVVVER